MTAIIDLLRESVLIQGILTLSVIGAALYLIVTRQPVPPELFQLMWAIVGFYFGSKVENAKMRSAVEAREKRR